MKKLIVKLTVEFEEDTDLSSARMDLESAIQTRLFGEGIFDEATLVDTWGMTTEINNTPIPVEPARVKVICEECGSTDVRRDAWASWDEEIQDWVLCEVYDSSFCIDCETEMALVEEEIKP